MKRFFAAISIDGPAFGIGTSPMEALQHAKEFCGGWEQVSTMEVAEITPESAAKVLAGDPDAYEIVHRLGRCQDHV